MVAGSRGPTKNLHPGPPPLGHTPGRGLVHPRRSLFVSVITSIPRYLHGRNGAVVFVLYTQSRPRLGFAARSRHSTHPRIIWGLYHCGHWAGGTAGHLGAESPSRRSAGTASARKASPPCPHRSHGPFRARCANAMSRCLCALPFASSRRSLSMRRFTCFELSLCLLAASLLRGTHPARAARRARAPAASTSHAPGHSPGRTGACLAEPWTCLWQPRAALHTGARAPRSAGSLHTGRPTTHVHLPVAALSGLAHGHPCPPLRGLAHGPANERRRTTTKRCCVPTRAQSRRRRSMGYGNTGRSLRQRSRSLVPPMRAWLTQPHSRHHKAPPQPCALTTYTLGHSQWPKPPRFVHATAPAR